jgi:hypothetical protein
MKVQRREDECGQKEDECGQKEIGKKEGKRKGRTEGNECR